MKLNHTIVFCLAGFVIFGFQAVAQNTPSTTSTNPVLTTSGVKTGNTLALSAAESPDHTTLFQLLKASGLTKQASGAGPYTVFAPNNGAFSEFSKEDLDDLLLPSSKNRLIKLLAYHVVKGRITSDQLKDGQTLTNLAGQILTVHKQENYITIEDDRGTVADVIQGNVRATNGVVYSINKVLQPASNKGPIVR
ncbi:fasciclin domain-containing protein [Spirosoma foliorum]|uniref:Fasciclin domain-containing protein n=1 Tax=Spirosoma foliorum TaxID=2710596 RepID=A0A7G5GXI7_9BACT|nr:fasciclin domain-containing protein [Spirosoma foliorum]QMW03579.1 fasciclin domain-containing protein [Spirosoma foliorum]